MSDTESKNPQRVAGGLKAAMHNPNTSDEAKQSAQERLQEMGADVEYHQNQAAATKTSAKNTGNVLVEIYLLSCFFRFHMIVADKNTSQEAKEHSRQVLEHADDDEAELDDADYNPDQDV
ncbi:hypothetical protein AMATHDRAFT_2486 [Amanita thiersii Skay4041]|uniref:Conidiation protein 6 n=1 Tax=Amanita thiersii Skay4041 TaxID=703135 RepID=A0A2A9NUP9_9AGAR|nr:hypothetical protein AMATHDRAFT_2486 [Amanita thiersii Skay4041]